MIGLIQKFRRKIFLIKSRGNFLFCPICGYHGNNALHIGQDSIASKEYNIIGAGLRNAGCIKCGSTDRERLIYLFIKDYLAILKYPKDTSILHIAPELKISNWLKKIGFLKYRCGDFFTEGYNYPSDVENMDIRNLKIESETVDLIICNHVLEHIAEDGKAMAELFRVLRPGGRAILQVPIGQNLQKTLQKNQLLSPSENEKVYGQFDHVRIYSSDDYVAKLENSGFQVKVIDITDNYNSMRLNKSERIYLASKKSKE